MQPFNILADLFASKKPSVSTNQCLPANPIDLSTAKTAPLQKLAMFQNACHSRVTDTVMIFFSTPTNDDQAQTYAAEDALALQDFAVHGIRPLVIAEPTQRDGAQIDFNLLASGQNNSAINTYFAALKAAGITDEQLGIWNPLPEPNLENWLNANSQSFAPALNNYVSVLKANFPAARTSILLNSATETDSNSDWQSNSESLLPYVKGINKGSVDFVGLQGFPWMARQGQAGSILNAAEFLPPELLTEIADFLGTKKVWLNTGTFGAKYTLDPEQTVRMAPERRSAILATILNQAQILKDKGYEISLNIFCEDKSLAAEETDWSYWHEDPFASDAAPVITDFIRTAAEQSLNIWIFDK